MMEVVIVGVVAIGLGALATFLLATQIPEQLLIGGQDHGRYGYLGESNETVDAPSSKRMEAIPLLPAFAFARSRNRYNANPLREGRRRRAVRASNRRHRGDVHNAAYETAES